MGQAQDCSAATIQFSFRNRANFLSVTIFFVTTDWVFDLVPLSTLSLFCVWFRLLVHLFNLPETEANIKCFAVAAFVFFSKELIQCANWQTNQNVETSDRKESLNSDQDLIFFIQVKSVFVQFWEGKFFDLSFWKKKKTRMLSNYTLHTVHLGQCVFAANFQRNRELLRQMTHSTIKNGT